MLEDEKEKWQTLQSRISLTVPYRKYQPVQHAPLCKTQNIKYSYKV
jgi:hypothetical protein